MAASPRRTRGAHRAQGVLRVCALLALVLWILNAWYPRGETPEVVRGDALSDELPRLTATAPAVVARLDRAPGARERDWLAAMRDAGVSVEWTGDVAPLALETYPVTDPMGGTFVLVSAPEMASVGDALGPVDTIDAGRRPAMVRLGDARGDITLTSGREVARTSLESGEPPRRVMVAGAAGWEAKFLVAALEEAGWQVDARLRVRPDEVVAQGGGAPDTATHAAVVLLDTTAVSLPLDRFVRAGGGLLLVGDASRSRLAAPLVAWRVGERENAPLGVLPHDTLWRGQSRVSFTGVDTARAIVLERRDGKPVIVARRHYAGRVLAVGYDDTWRWRMAGSGNSVAEHRAWWSRHVASVAMRPSRVTRITTGAAPLAALHASLGPPAGPTDASPGLPRALLANVLAAIALACLLAEWLLRRLKGLA